MHIEIRSKSGVPFDVTKHINHFLEHTEEYCGVCGARERLPVHKDDCTCLKPCPDCKDGEREVMDMSRVHGRTVTPPFHWVKCETCNGEGEL